MATINGTNNSETLDGTSLDDIIWGMDGHDTLNGKAGADEMHGGIGNDTYWVENVGDTVHELAGQGTDKVLSQLTWYTLGANVENLVYTGLSTSNFTGIGNALDNSIEGWNGNDILDGKGGADTLKGLGGNDTYWVDSNTDVVIEAAGQGTDSVRTFLTHYTLGANLENLYYHGSSTADFYGTGNALDNFIEGWSGNDTLDGGVGADTLKGMLGNDIYVVDNAGDVVIEAEDAGTDWVFASTASHALAANVENLQYNGLSTASFTGYGNALVNMIITKGGDDTLDGGEGADTMVGGAGNDTYYVDNAGDLTLEEPNEGIDTVKTNLASLNLDDNIERLIYNGPSNVNFSGTGNELDNYIEGWNGHDVLNGALGADTMKGFNGNDVYWVDNVGDVVIEGAGGGTDEVKTGLAEYTLGANVENLRLINDGSFFSKGFGNGLDNVMTGSNGANLLNGLGGNDTMYGLGGNDQYIVDEAGDVVVEDQGAGQDVVYGSLAVYGLTANVENFSFNGLESASTKIFGNALDNFIVTKNGDDTLDGMGGADTMHGLGGNDTYYVDNAGDKVEELANNGIDTVRTTTASYILPLYVEKLIYEGPVMASFTGTGNLHDNYLEGWTGADILDGKAGADTMVGMGGNDVYHVDNLGDIVTENVGGGIDEVVTAVGSRVDPNAMFVLAAHVENLTGTSATDQGVFANASDNVVKMGGGNDLIVMHDGGIDMVSAGAGDDFIHFGNALTSADSIDGGLGYDTVGLLGDTTVVFNATTMVGVEKLAVYSSGGAGTFDYNITMADNNVATGGNMMVVAQSLLPSESLTFDGSAELDGTFNVRGGKGADAITGGAKADQIWGNLGADTLKGGGGKDQFEYFAANESTAAQRDTILDFTLGDKINLQAIDADNNAANGNGKFTFVGSGAFTGAAGELRVFGSNGSWTVEADTNGDSVADLVIGVNTTGGHILGAADFYL